jgi:hypothetical protein
MTESFRTAAARSAAAVLVVLLTAALLSTAAQAAKVTVKDPSGEYPDIVSMTGNHAKKRSVVTIRFGEAAVDAVTASAYVRSGKRVYQAFDAPAAGLRELRFKGKKVTCKGLKVARNVKSGTVRFTVPRKCTPKLKAKVQFKAVATEGLMSVDETKWSKKVKRG